jgi:hypothetical protein
LVCSVAIDEAYIRRDNVIPALCPIVTIVERKSTPSVTVLIRPHPNDVEVTVAFRVDQPKALITVLR